MDKSSLERCTWPGSDPLYIKYHDEEWGVPVWESKKLFAKLILDGAQAGLSWITILRKIPAYEVAFDGLDPDIMMHYSPVKVEELMSNPGIVRNKLKITAAINNASVYQKIEENEGSFSDFLWQFVGHKPIINYYKTNKEVPASTPESDQMSKALKKYGFKFAGTTIVYAFMQAVGMVNDHLTSCFRHSELLKKKT